MLESIYDLEKIFVLQSIDRTCFCTVICPFTANSSRLPCIGSADFFQELGDTTIPSTRATLGQSDGVQRQARRGGSGCHISEVA